MDSPDASEKSTTAGAPLSRQEVESTLRELWSDVLNRPAETIGVQDNFFAMGGDSILVVELMGRVHAKYFSGKQDSAPGIAQFFSHGTICTQATLIAGEVASSRHPAPRQDGADAIAVIGLACRVPGASDPRAFWNNLCAGVESLTRLSDAELLDAGVPDTLLAKDDYIKVVATVADPKTFDASYFGITPKDAALMSPEQRVLAECCEEALQDAGYGDTRGIEGAGVFVGTGVSSYLLDRAGDRGWNLETMEGVSLVAATTSSAARMSYILDLRGPSATVDTACSSSLVAVHHARMAILAGECSIALAGGATIRRTSPLGYWAQDGGIFSKEGHCRPFSPRADGTVPASGGAVLVLKRLSEAIAHRDHIYAVIRGSATNNDGGAKVGFTAPSAEGQEDVIRLALASASVTSADIQYVEAHGTGTLLGDRIEAGALARVFPVSAFESKSKLLGAVKANVGHLEAAAGITGLLKAVLAVHHGLIPPAIHQNKENPVDFADSAFEMNADLRRWPQVNAHRRAGVSSFGIGGTNAHVIVESVAPPDRLTPDIEECLLVLSAPTESALCQSCRRLARYLRSQNSAHLPDIAFTLQVGRRAFRHRHFVVASTKEQAAAKFLEFQYSAESVRSTIKEELEPSNGERYTQLAALGAAWRSGALIDWNAINAHGIHYRVPLPPCPFEGREHWLPPGSRQGGASDSAGDRQSETGHHIYLPTWQQRRLTVTAHAHVVQRRSVGDSTCMLINGPAELEAELRCRSSRLGMRFVHVTSSDRNVYGASECSVDGTNEEAYVEMLRNLQAEGHHITNIVHCEQATGTDSPMKTPALRRQQSVDSVLELSRAIALCRIQGTSITLVTEGGQAIGSAESLDAYGSMRTAIAGVIPKELPEVVCRCVDVSSTYGTKPSTAETMALVDEAFSASADAIVAVRGSSRWLRAFERLTVDDLGGLTSLLEEGGVYIVVGGLGGIGWTLAKHMGRNYRARLAIIGRTEFPARDRWKEPARCESERRYADQIAEVSELEQHGAEVLIIQGDVTSRTQMESAVACVCEQFGRVDGVIHAAGIPGVGPLQQRNRASSQEVMAAKVEGTQVLFEALRGVSPKFFVCCSSVAAVTAPAGLADYSAASAYQDAFCLQQGEQSSIVCISINWGAWRDVGFATKIGREVMATARDYIEDRNAIRPDDGARIFDWIMKNPQPQYVVSSAGPGAFSRNRVLTRLPSASQTTLEHHASPTESVLQGAELIVAEIWREVLGVCVEKADDDFFELGGDSISLLELRDLLESRTQLSVPLNKLTQASTISAMAKLLLRSS